MLSYITYIDVTLRILCNKNNINTKSIFLVCKYIIKPVCLITNNNR